jgi:GNAT superfamily N-acetyltransferase
VSRVRRFESRVASVADVDEIADAHRDSIQSLGPAFYPPQIVAAWQTGISGDLYRRAMENGEVFFVAVGELDGRRRVLGFASDYLIEGSCHGASCYVRGRVARHGVGTTLLQLAAAHAIAQGATDIEIESSLAAVDFYRANGFIELRRGETTLTTGHPIACVFMRKVLVRTTSTSARFSH